MEFASLLLKWYDVHRRTLPWRGEHDPYRVWLSEIMLQQTQAAMVEGYYARFLRRFPDVRALAAAGEDEVMKLWEGLGYYSRARNLHAAAKVVSGTLGGNFPDTAEGLRGLPGVGPYAANAIASIAYGEPVPALDGNQARVLSRVLAWEPPIRTPFDLIEPARELLSDARPGDYNQALMDLGTMICTPRRPRCESCPVAELCRARAEDAAMDFPRKPAPVARKTQEWTILLLLHDHRLLVRRRPAGLLGGLYEFAAVEGHHDPDALENLLAEMGFAGAKLGERLCDSRHVFTHLVWHMRGWSGACDAVPDGFIAVDAAALDALAFPSALRTYLQAAKGLLEKNT